MTPTERLIKMAQLVNLANTPHTDPFEAVLREDDTNLPEDSPEDIAEYEANLAEDDRDTERYWLDKAIDAYDDRVERKQNADEDWDR